MGMTWRIPSSTQTERAGFWNSVRCRVLLQYFEELLLLNPMSELGIFIEKAALRSGCSLRLCCDESPLLYLTFAGFLNSTWIVSSEICGLPFLWHVRLNFWLVSSAWRGLWSELLIRSSSFSLSLFLWSLCLLLPCDSHPLLLLLLLVFSGGMYYSCRKRKQFISK